MADNIIVPVAPEVGDFLVGNTPRFDSIPAQQLGWSAASYKALRVTALKSWCTFLALELPSSVSKATCFSRLAMAGVGPTGPPGFDEAPPLVPRVLGSLASSVMPDPPVSDAAAVAPLAGAPTQLSSEELLRLRAILSSNPPGPSGALPSVIQAMTGPLPLPDESVSEFEPAVRPVFAPPSWWNAWLLPADLRSAKTLEPRYRASWSKDLPSFTDFPQPVAFTKSDLAGLDPLAKRLLSQTLPAVQKRALDLQRLRLYSLACLETSVDSGTLSATSSSASLFRYVEGLQGLLQREIFAEWDQLSRITSDIRSVLLQRRAQDHISIEDLAGVAPPNLAFSAEEEERLAELQAKRAAAAGAKARPPASRGGKQQQRGNGRGRLGKSRTRSRDRGRSPASQGADGYQRSSQPPQQGYRQQGGYPQQQGSNRSPPYSHSNNQRGRGGGRGGRGGYNPPGGNHSNNQGYQGEE